MAGTFYVDISELTAITDKFAHAQPIVKSKLNAAARTAGFAVEGNAKTTAPVDKGYLKARIRAGTPRQSGISTTVAITSHATYSAAVHDGRKEVRPVRAKVLAWQGRNGMVFSMRSRAVAANPYMDRGLKASEGQITKAFDKALADTLKALGL